MGPFIANTLFQYSKLRSAAFELQGRLFTTLGQRQPGPEICANTRINLDRALDNLLKRDSRNISRGRYPVTVLKPESFTAPLVGLPRVAWDGLLVQRKKLLGEAPPFSPQGYPADLLFHGATDAMRRMLLVPMKRALKTKDGAGLRILEIGAGTGESTRFASLAFPKAKIVAVDLSHTDLQQARQKLSAHSRIDFVQADGSQLPFKPRQFDAVFSVFLFHELPWAMRKAVLRESLRVARPGGFLGVVDSLQWGDQPELDGMLEQFPKYFHEPFFRNYLDRPLETHLAEIGLRQIRKSEGFLSKACWGKKPESGVPHRSGFPGFSVSNPFRQDC